MGGSRDRSRAAPRVERREGCIYFASTTRHFPRGPTDSPQRQALTLAGVILGLALVAGLVIHELRS